MKSKLLQKKLNQSREVVDGQRENIEDSQGLGSGHGFPRRPHDVNEALVQQVRSLFKV
jgi:hypothetical protein